MLGLTKRVLEEYKPLIAKLALDSTKRQQEEFEALEQETMLALPCLVPMLFAVNSLIKFVQSPSCYVVSCILAVKIWEAHLYSLYVDPTYYFQCEEFQQFLSPDDDTSPFI